MSTRSRGTRSFGRVLQITAELLAPVSCSTATVMAALDAARSIRPLMGAVVAISGCGMLGLTAVASATGDGTADGLHQALRRVPAARSGYEAVRFLARPESAALAELVGDIHPLQSIESAMRHARAQSSVRVGLRPNAVQVAVSG